jgi:hypothetical protein
VYIGFNRRAFYICQFHTNPLGQRKYFLSCLSWHNVRTRNVPFHREIDKLRPEISSSWCVIFLWSYVCLRSPRDLGDVLPSIHCGQGRKDAAGKIIRMEFLYSLFCKYSHWPSVRSLHNELAILALAGRQASTLLQELQQALDNISFTFHSYT